MRSPIRSPLPAIGLAALASLAWATVADAQTPRQAQADSLRREVAAMAARLDSLEAGVCPAARPALGPLAPTGDPTTDSLAAAVRRLDARLTTAAARCAPVPAPADSADALAAIRAAAAEAAAEGEPAAADTALPREFVSRQRNLSALNPEITVTGDLRLVAREGRQADNAVDREFEFSFQSALDPYSNAKAFLAVEQEEIAIEEGYLYWTGLPGRLRLDAGKFRQPVGDLNRWHSHALPESEYPLVYRRYFGEEGLAGVGLSLYTTLPIGLAGGTHELWLQGTTSEVEPLIGDSRQPLVLGRLQNFWQVTRSAYAQVGFTGLAGRNDDADRTGNVLGVDLRVTVRPPSDATRRDLTLRAEGYRIHTNTAGIAESRYGGFLDVQFRANRRWILGGRYDRVESVGGAGSEWMVSPTITWWQSEFVYLRLEGQRSKGGPDGDETRALLQIVWAMGPHKHETY